MHPAVVALATCIALTLALATTTSAIAQTPTKKPAGKTAAATKAAAATGAAGAVAAAAAAPAAPKEPEPVPYVWEKEPDSFLGVKFIEPMSLPACPTKRDFQNSRVVTLDHEGSRRMASVCYDPTDPFTETNAVNRTPYRYTLENLPIIGIPYTVHVFPTNDVVTKITIDLKASGFDTLLQVFKERYGPPTLEVPGKVSNALGAEFSNTTVLWQGKTISISMTERTNKID